MIARVGRRLRRQAAFTVVELVVAIGVGSVVSLAAFSLIDHSIVLTGKTHARVDSNQRGRQAMDEITRQLRSQVCPDSDTPALVAADDYSISFWSFQGSGAFQPRRHTIAWDPTTQRITDTVDSGANTATLSTRVLLTNGRLPNNTPLFRYYAYPSSGTIEPTSPVSTPVAGGALSSVARIEVSFTVDPAIKGNPASSGTPAEATAYTASVFARTADPDSISGTQGPACQ